MHFTPSKRSQISPFLAMDVLSRANSMEKEGHSILHMEVGQPGASAPQCVINEAQKWLNTGKLSYTDALGVDGLRERIARHYQEKYKQDISKERIAITPGSSGGFNLAFLAAFDAGDKIGLPSPGYPAYRNILTSLGLEVIDIPVLAEDRFTLSVERLKFFHQQHGLKGVLIASPANPTGTMLSAKALQDICSFCDEEGIRFISDEIYHGLVFEGDEETALAYSDNVIVVNSFSKYYCMTGWRIGWMVLPENLVRPVECLAQNLFISAHELSQRAAIVAFDGIQELEEIKKGYALNRELLLSEFTNMGLKDFFPADGAFYVYVNFQEYTNDTKAFTAKMLQETGIAATPGADFDPVSGNTYVRFSFAGLHEDMKEAMKRLSSWLPTL